MRLILKACLLSCSLLSVPAVFFTPTVNAAQTTEAEDPFVLFEKVTQKAFVRFKQEWPEVQKDPEQLKSIIRDELLPYIDYEYAAFKVLGKYVRDVKAEDRQAFVNAFRDYIVTVYAQLFTKYRDTQSIVVEPSRDIEDSKIAVVKSKIIEPGRPDISVTFKLIQRNNEWRAFDMEAEGISMLNTKRKEIGSAIPRVGIKAIISDLVDKANQRLNVKSDSELAAE